MMAMLKETDSIEIITIVILMGCRYDLDLSFGAMLWTSFHTNMLRSSVLIKMIVLQYV